MNFLISHFIVVADDRNALYTSWVFCHENLMPRIQRLSVDGSHVYVLCAQHGYNPVWPSWQDMYTCTEYKATGNSWVENCRLMQKLTYIGIGTVKTTWGIDGLCDHL